jgi:hypothetical protein
MHCLAVVPQSLLREPFQESACQRPLLRRIPIRMQRHAENPQSGLLRNFQAVLFPGFEAAVHFHDGITLRGKLHRGVGTHVTVLRIAVNDVHRIPAQTGQRAPFFLRKIDRAGDVAFLEIFGLAHVYDDDIRAFLNLVAYFDGAGRESHFVREELFRLGRIALECFSHNSPTVEFRHGLQCRPSKKIAAH